MVKKWFGESCIHQLCKFESDSYGIEDRSQPVLIYCNHKGNTQDYEGNCSEVLCPLNKK